jgi:hypothetical protein
LPDYIIHLLIPLEVRVINVPNPEAAKDMAQWIVNNEKLDKLVAEALDLTSFSPKPALYNFTEEPED